MDSNGQMNWKSEKMDRRDQLGNGSLNQRNGTGGNEDELASEIVKKLLGWPWTMYSVCKKGLNQSCLKVSGMGVDPLKNAESEGRAVQGKYDEFSFKLVKLEILG